MTRRELLQWLGISAAGALSAAPGSAVEPSRLPPLNRFPRMMQEFMAGRIRAIERTAAAAKAALQSSADAEAYIRRTRERIRSCFGPMPERTPLNARTTGTVERDAYVIEKVLFESRPGFLVAANLYLPRGDGKKPGVVGSCGHSNNGKAAEAYQAFAQGLARQGYVVLIFDPIGQGERLQYGHLEARQRPGIGVGEHLYAGNQQFLIGEFFGAWRAWDGIRALDYLLSRAEVDPRHVGITGNSGGGTMTTWLCALDERWTMAAPGCFVTTFRRNFENELPQDTEQCPPRALALGLDHDDFLACMAPRPVIILAKEKDFFDVRGSEEAYRRLKRLYTLLGQPDNIRLHVGPTGHGYTRENREAMYAWFHRAAGITALDGEPKLTIEKDETLWCTPTGQVADLKSRTVFSFTQARSRDLARARRPLGAADLKRELETRLRLPERKGVPEYRILRPITRRGYPLPAATPFAVETEPGVFAVAYRLGRETLLSRPPAEIRRAILYVAHHSADAELREQPWLKELFGAEPESAAYACDVRGVGESRPDTCGDDQFLKPYGSDYFYAIHALMLDRPYVGQKTHDVLRVLDWLFSAGHREVHLAGAGWGAVPALFAAALHDAVKQATLRGAPSSYAAIAEAETYDWPLSAFVPGILEALDLPDCRQLLAQKRLREME